jgi:hypothetical protein
LFIGKLSATLSLTTTLSLATTITAAAVTAIAAALSLAALTAALSVSSLLFVPFSELSNLVRSQTKILLNVLSHQKGSFIHLVASLTESTLTTTAALASSTASTLLSKSHRSNNYQCSNANELSKN